MSLHLECKAWPNYQNQFSSVPVGVLGFPAPQYIWKILMFTRVPMPFFFYHTTINNINVKKFLILVFWNIFFYISFFTELNNSKFILMQLAWLLGDYLCINSFVTWKTTSKY